MLAALSLRRVLLLLLLAGGGVAFAQTAATVRSVNVGGPTIANAAMRQQQRDRAFLARRGIARAPAMAQLQAARAQQLRLATAAAETALASSGPAASTTVWQSAGPVQLTTPPYGLVTGRVSSLAVDPNDTTGNTVYLGATGGGVWQSTNAAGNAGSVHFVPLTDDLPVFANSFTSFPSLSIGALSVQPGNPQVLLAGTGDPNDALDAYYGVGILRSGDGGQTWTLIQENSDFSTDTVYSMLGLGFAGFAWSTTAPNLVVAAASQADEGLLVDPSLEGTTEAGLYYSSDAGQTWHLATITDGTNEIIQSTNPPTGPPGNPATSVVWNPKRSLFLAAVRFHGYYSSPDGMTWTRLANQPANLSLSQCPTESRSTGSRGCPIYRGVLAVQPTTGDTFALTTDLNNVDQGLYQDVCSPSGLAVSTCSSNTISFGTRIADSAIEASGGTIAQADYNLTLAAVSSEQDTILFAGAEDLFRCSLANSCTWRNTTNTATCAAAQVAPSMHAIDSTFGANGLLYFGNDGGLWRSTDTVAQTGSVCAATDAAHFQNLNDAVGSLAEVSHLAVSPANASLVLAGMGEFGIVASESTAAQGGTGAWQQLLTGEGSFVAIDPSTPANWYADSGAGLSIFQCAGGGNCNAAGFGASPVISRTQVEDDTDYLVTNGFNPAPWILDPLNPQNILLGTCRMWLGPVTGSWSASNLLSTMLDGDQSSFCNGNAAVRSVGAGGSYNSAQGGEQMYAGIAGQLDGGGIIPGRIFGATVPQAGGTVTWNNLWRNPVTNISMSSQMNAGGNAVSTIAVDPHDPSGDTVYVGMAGFPTGTDGIVYRSTDAGAHWANITSSLPFGPVNSIVVDPTSAGTVYVGGDFGVYSTTNVTSCSVSTQNCWSQLGAKLPNAPVTDLKVVSISGSSVLEAATYGRGIWTLGLANTAALGQGSLSPGSYTFAAQATGSASSTVASFTLANTGTVPLLIAQISTAPTDYTQSNNCGASLAVGAACTLQVSFDPSATGDRPGSLTVRVNTAAGTLSSTLDGTGLTPGAVGLSPSSLGFPVTAVGAASAAQAVTVTNTGGAPLQLGSITIAGSNASDFTLAGGNSCGSTLNAGASCTIPVSFAPTQTGARSGQLKLTASAAGSPFLVPLSGNGVAPAALTLSPASLSFAALAQNSVSPAQSITVSNPGGLAAQLGSASVSGDYVLSADSCGASLAPGATCVVSIEFAPTATGTRAGLFTLPSPSLAAGQVTAMLSGTGLSPPSITLTPASLTFTAQTVATTSAAQTITLANTAGSTAQLGTATASGDFTVTADTCPAALAVGSSCTLSVTFTPTTVGARSGVLSVPVNSAHSTASLSGTGTAPAFLSVNPASLSFPVTAQGTSAAAENVVLTNSGGSPAVFTTSTVTGPFAIAANGCPVSPQTLAVNATCTLAITFTPVGISTYSGAVNLGGNFSNSPASVPLSGQGATPSAAVLSPTSLSFPPTAQGSTSTPQTITITSNGGVAVTLGAPSVTSEYQISSNTCPGSLAPGSTCSVSILFHPGGTGARPAGTFSQPGSMTNSPLVATLSGTGLSPGVIALTPTAINFGAQTIGTTSAVQTVQVANTGGAPIAVGTPSVSGDYLLGSSTCPATLAAAQTCSLAVSFRPASTGDRPGQLTVPGDGSSSAAVTTLDGRGVTPAQLSVTPASLAFGTVATGSAANGTVTVANSGGTAADFAAIAAGGDFSVTGGSCSVGTPVAASGGSCTVVITFQPTATGSRSGTLTLTNDGSPATVQAALAGVGATAGNLALSPSTLTFGSVVISNTAPAQTITATNSGGVAVALGAAAIAGSGYALTANSCGTQLDAGASCAVQVSFTPTVAGASAGTFHLPGAYSGSPATVSLQGTGVTPGALSLMPSPVAFGQVVTGSTATVTVTVTNTGGAAVTVGTASGSSGFSVVSQCGATLAPAASCTLLVSFSPTVPGSATGLLIVPASTAGGQQTDALAGTAILPGSLAATPGSLTFPATGVGGNSNAQTITFSNPGGVSVALAPLRLVSADYSITGTTCGSSLAPSATCTAAVVFHPAAVGNRSATLTLASSTAGGPSVLVTLNGPALAAAQLAFSPASFNFGTQPEQTTTAAQSFMLTNTGGVATALGLPVLTGQYAITANSCGNSLAAGLTCRIAVQFAPVSSGSLPGQLSLAGAGGAPSATASLSGRGTPLALSLTVPQFATPVPVGTSVTSATALTVENVGPLPLTLTTLTISGDFSIASSSCGATLAADASCSLFITFTPTASGLRTGTFTVSDGTDTVSEQLSGTGLSPATDTLSTGSLTFGVTVIGRQPAPTLSLTLTNNGDANLNQIAVATTGAFSAASNCGSILGGHLSCAITVGFSPTALGNNTGTLSVSDQTRTQTVALSGTGAAPPQAFASPSSLSFGAYAQGIATPAQTVLISNGGTTPMAPVSLAVAGADFAVASTTCGGTIAPGGSCQVGIVFTPGVIGDREGTLTATSSSLAEPLAVSLSGSGEDFQLSVVGSATSVVTDGQTATYQLSLTPLGASAGTVAIACTGAPANAVCTANPAAVTVAGETSGSIVLSVQTQGVASAALLPQSQPQSQRKWWVSALALVLLLPSRRSRRLLAMLLAAVLLTAPIACGVHASGVSGSGSGSGGGGQTQSGSYPLTVTASFPGAQRSASVTLVVQ